MIYLGGWSRAKERRIQIYSPSLPPSPPRATSFTPPPLLAASLLLALGFIDPLYIYLLCRGPLCHGSKGSRRCTCRPLPHPLLTTPAIFGQYYKNQPTDFLRKILPPCSPEYFIAVHPSPPSSSSLPPPVSKGERGGGQKAAEGDRSRERHAIRFCFVARSSSSSSPLVSGFRAKGEGREKQGDIVAVKRLRDLSLYRRVGKRGTIAAIVSSIRPWNRWNLCSIDERESKEARFLPICHVASRLVFSARIERERGAGQQRGLLLI